MQSLKAVDLLGFKRRLQRLRWHLLQSEDVTFYTRTLLRMLPHCHLLGIPASTFLPLAVVC